MVMTTKKASKILEKYRNERGFTFKYIAEHMTPVVHPTYIAGLEKGKDKLTYDRANQLSYILRMTEKDRLEFLEAAREDRKSPEEKKFDAEIERVKKELNEYLDAKYKKDK